MKKFFYMLVFWLVSVLAIVIGSGAYKMYLSSGYDKTARPYIREAVTEISNWDPATTRALMAKEVAAKIPEGKFTRAMALFSRLGKLQSMQEPEFEKDYVDQETELGKQTIVEYNTAVKYTNGDAIINLKLLDKGGHYELYSFNFRSEALLE